MENTNKHYRVVLFYARAHQPTFATQQEALNYIKARALTKHTACYTELWEMSLEDDGELQMVFDYGCTEPQQLNLSFEPQRSAGK